MPLNELDAKIREFRELQALIDEAITEAEVVKDAIKAYRGTQKELRAGEYKVVCCKPVTENKLDSTALKIAAPYI